MSKSKIVVVTKESEIETLKNELEEEKNLVEFFHSKTHELEGDVKELLKTINFLSNKIQSLQEEIDLM